MARPYVYHYAKAFTRSHKLSQAIARKELDKAGFEIASSCGCLGALRDQRRHDHGRDERPAVAEQDLRARACDGERGCASQEMGGRNSEGDHGEQAGLDRLILGASAGGLSRAESVAVSGGRRAESRVRQGARW